MTQKKTLAKNVPHNFILLVTAYIAKLTPILNIGQNHIMNKRNKIWFIDSVRVLKEMNDWSVL